ncbi:alpha/beta hydrolase [Pseudomonas sp. NPDC089392]|uniref:alpha/beta hydrolase n=1 Tax=Pseudomonas sp. NPDC089392 TaxID=3364459 RepID=UPI0038094F2A
MLPRLFSVTALLLMLLAGCASPQQKLAQWAQANGATTHVIHTAEFSIQTVTPANFKPGRRLTLYIEGDGHAWATSTQPSLDPSPRTFALAKLATGGYPGIYLARPCQFITSPACNTSVWTDARFSAAVVEAMAAAVDQLVRRYGASSVELIGYSGGAAIALLIAERRHDVSQVQSIAGNLDPAAWVRYHGLSPLVGSLDPMAEISRLANTPERHFSGADDRIIAPALTSGYAQGSQLRCVQVVSLPGDHATVLKGFDARLLRAPISCVQAPTTGSN